MATNALVDPVSAEYEEEPTEVDTNEDISEADEELREPLTFTEVDQKFVRYITPQQRQSLLTRQNNRPTSSSTTTSMESDLFQYMSSPTSNKRKRANSDNELDTTTTRQRPPARLQLELGYDGTRGSEWSALRVSIHIQLFCYGC